VCIAFITFQYYIGDVTLVTLYIIYIIIIYFYHTLKNNIGERLKLFEFKVLNSDLKNLINLIYFISKNIEAFLKCIIYIYILFS